MDGSEKETKKVLVYGALVVLSLITWYQAYKFCGEIGISGDKGSATIKVIGEENADFVETPYGKAYQDASENPLTSGYAEKYGVDFSELDYILEAQLKSGVEVVTRPAPGLGNNVGGAIEIVTPPDSVELKIFYMR